MKKIILFLFIMFMVSGCSKNAAALSAEQVAYYFAEHGLPVGNFRFETAVTNDFLGLKPGLEITLARFDDQRTVYDGVDVASEKYTPYNVIYAFKSKDDMQTYLDHMMETDQNMGITTKLPTYHTDTVIVRLMPQTPPEALAEYEKIILEIPLNIEVVLAAPKATPRIESLR